jgi:hypothetical protein
MGVDSPFVYVPGKSPMRLTMERSVKKRRMTASQAFLAFSIPTNLNEVNCSDGPTREEGPGSNLPETKTWPTHAKRKLVPLITSP